MRIITSAPILIPNTNRNKNDINIGSDEFLPFDGHTDMIEVSDGDGGETMYWSAEGDCYYNAKGEKIKKFFSKIGKGLGKAGKGVFKGIKAVGKAIVKAERWVVSKSKNLVKGAKKGAKGAKPKGPELTHVKTGTGADAKDVFTQKLVPATATTPSEQIVTVEGQKFAAVDVPKDKPIVVATDPNTGQKTVGVEYRPEEVAGVESADGTYSYYKQNDVPKEGSGLSTNVKIGIAIGSILLVGGVIYMIAKNKKK